MENLPEANGIVNLHTVKGKQPLYVVDGKIIPDAEFQKIKPADIESISVLKENSAIQMYGDKGKHGVVLIETKKDERKKKDKDIVSIGSGSMESLQGDVERIVINANDSETVVRIKDRNSQDMDIFNGKPPLFIIDGEKKTKDFKLNTIDPNDIESISVLKDKSAADIYGDEGINGVIIITKKNRIGADPSR